MKRRIRPPHFRRELRLEFLEDRSLLTAAHVFQNLVGEVAAPGGQQAVAFDIDADYFTPAGRSTALGFHVQAAAGSTLDPAAIVVERLGGGLIAPVFTTNDIGGTASLVVAKLPAGAYQLNVRGQGGTTGGFVVDVFMAGDVDGNQEVNQRDAAALVHALGSNRGPSYRAEADVDLDGKIGIFDLAMLQVNFGTKIRPATITEISPTDGEEHVNLKRETIVRFDERIDPATITSDSFHAIAKGQRLAGHIDVSSTERFATIYYDTPLPASTEVRIVVDGNLIRGRDGALLDADGDGLAGGIATADFRTLPLTRIPGTNIFGYVYDSYHTNPDGSNIPVVGATIRVDAFPEANATTDANGYFILRDMPAPEFFVHVDGTTAINAPPGTIYPSVGKPFHTLPGQEIQLNMMGTPFNVYLPPMAAADVVTLSPTSDTPVGFGAAGKTELAAMFPDLDASVWNRLRVTFPAGSAVDNQGNPATQAVVIPVPPDRIPAPLPPFVDPQLVISIQAIGAENFDVPAPVSFPNLDGLPPGAKTLILSFDHDAGGWKSIGSATVSADGLTVDSDPGVGVLAPGWHVNVPGSDNGNGSCGGGSGAGSSPLAPEASPSRNPTPVGSSTFELPPETKLIVGQPGSGFFPDLSWGSGSCASGGAPPPPGPLPVGALHVRIQIDGPLAQFMKQAGDQPVDTDSDFVILDPSTEGRTFKALPQFYFEMFGSGGIKNIDRDQLYGAKITVTEEETIDDGNGGTDTETTIRTFYPYRWVAVVHPGTPDAFGNVPASGGTDTAAFFRTIADGAGGFVRNKNVDMFLPAGFATEVVSSSVPVFQTGSAITSGSTIGHWQFDPPSAGPKTANLNIVAHDTTNVTIGTLKAIGTATAPTTINVNLTQASGYAAELKRVILSLRSRVHPGVGAANPQPGIDNFDDDVDGVTDELDEYLSNGSNDSVEVIYFYPSFDSTAATTITFGGQTLFVLNPNDPNFGNEVVVSSRFKSASEFAGFMPDDRSPGPDGILFTADDTFAGGDLDARVARAANDVMAAINQDYAIVNTTGVTGYTIQDAPGDVNMTWSDQGAGLFGAAQFDLATNPGPDSLFGNGNDTNTTFQSVQQNANLSAAAKQWQYAEELNSSVANSGGFAVGINLKYSNSAVTFAQYVANTVSHEIAHTFGVPDSYLQVGTAIVNMPPLDIMMSGGPADPNLTFGPANTDALRAALGMQADGDLPLTEPLHYLRTNVNFDISATGIREEAGDRAALGVSLDNHLIFPGDSRDTGVVAADGPLGASATRQFVLANFGTIPLTIHSIELTSGTSGFSITAAPPDNTVIPPGATTTVTVVFDPATAGDFSDVLQIDSDYLGVPLYSVSLTGQGISPSP